VLVLTSSPDPAHVRRSLDAGATAVMLKDGNPATVLAGIRAVAHPPRPAGA
jgi:DNA-binding NarL/FixJ family response regulator